ncbi:MAG TPA: hypothetical protein P5061_01040, partial [Mycobacterium sp.]|nr:hypothetical protein [Mycobacterium sp.]
MLERRQGLCPRHAHAGSQDDGQDLNRFTVATFNVNGIRAARRRGFDDWLADRAPDIVALQELRCSAM